MEADEYALELSRYVHLNPVRAGMVRFPEDYQWSSYPSYIGYDPAPVWLNRSLVLSMFGTDLPASQKRYREFVAELIGKEYDSPLQETVASTILGGEDFVESIMANHVKRETDQPDVPAVRALNRRFHVENIIAKVQEIIDDPFLSRDVSLHLCHRYSGETLRNIGNHFGLGDSGVAKASARVEKRLEIDIVLRKKVKDALRCLGHVNIQT